MVKAFTILLADDDEDDCMLFTDALDEVEPHASLSCVQNGGALMQKLELLVKDGSIPQLLFLDLNMPVKNGMDCLFEIKSNPVYKGLRIVIFSTSAQKDAVRKAYDLGADLYLKKPDSFDSVKKALSNILTSFGEKDFHRPPFDQFLINLDTESLA